MTTSSRRRDMRDTKPAYAVVWIDDHTLEITFRGNVDGSVVAGAEQAIRKQVDGRSKPWSALFVGLEIERIAPDVRTAALSMLGFVRDSKPVIVIAATPNLPARMFGRSIAFALGLNMDVLDTRDEALKRIRAARK